MNSVMSFAALNAVKPFSLAVKGKHGDGSSNSIKVVTISFRLSASRTGGTGRLGGTKYMTAYGAGCKFLPLDKAAEASRLIVPDQKVFCT